MECSFLLKGQHPIFLCMIKEPLNKQKVTDAVSHAPANGAILVSWHEINVQLQNFWRRSEVQAKLLWEHVVPL